MSRVDEPCSSIILAWCEIRERLQIDAQGFFRPVRALSQVRNPSIADVFFGMRSMERVGSGLADVEDEMQRSGGKAVFSVDLRQQMLRKHWEAHLKRFRDNGLFIELKKDRAFFRELPRSP
jgi:hypothetical protein